MIKKRKNWNKKKKKKKKKKNWINKILKIGERWTLDLNLTSQNTLSVKKI